MLSGQAGREINEDVFSHENCDFPPSLTSQGQMHKGTKSEIIKCLESEVPAVYTSPKIDVTILDGAFIVQSLRPGTTSTFEEYADHLFYHYILSCLRDVSRLDILWDSYKTDSIKYVTRKKRGSGIRQRVTLTGKIPTNWQEFLRVDANKEELFELLAEKIQGKCVEGKQIVTTFREATLTAPIHSNVNVSHCNHEEADTRIFIHVTDATHQEFRKILIKSNDSDVVIIAVSCIQDLHLDELWVAYGTGKAYRYIPAHLITQQMGPAKSRALLSFHALTGCDTTSAFHEKGKKTAWNVWLNFPDVTDAFLHLSTFPKEVDDTVMECIENCVVRLYDSNPDITSVNASRLELFYYKGKDFKHMPPSRDALYLHTLGAAYQACHVWGQTLISCPQLRDPSDWGWTKRHQHWQPLWIIRPTTVQSA